MFGRLFLLPMMAFVAMSTANAGCDAFNSASDCEFDCPGCCTPDGACISGTSESQCGAGGELCVACSDGWRCAPSLSGGQCEGCDAFSCNGCCDLDGACLAGTADDTCGARGERCIDCGAGFCSSLSLGGGRCQ